MHTCLPVQCRDGFAGVIYQLFQEILSETHEELLNELDLVSSLLFLPGILFVPLERQLDSQENIFDVLLVENMLHEFKSSFYFLLG
jgi:hypothetical protein